MSLPRKPPNRDRVDSSPGVLEQVPDLTIQISLGDDAAGSRLGWTARSPLFEVAPSEEAPTSDIGEEAVTFARRYVDYASTAGDPQALFDYLIGTGREIAEKIPAEILQALGEVAARAGIGRRPCSLSAPTPTCHGSWRSSTTAAHHQQ